MRELIFVKSKHVNEKYSTEKFVEVYRRKITNIRVQFGFSNL